MKELWITETGLRILELLERFQFMTAEQITRAGNFKNKAVIRRVANEYAGRRAPLIHCKDFGAVPGMGRLHKIYALSEHGAEVLAEYRQCDPSEVGYLTGKIQFSIDYAHRLDFVDAHIIIREWAEKIGADIGFFYGYFETEGANRTGKDALKLVKKNKIELQNRRFIIPDGIFSFALGDKKRLCALEIHRGKDAKIILEQLEKHIDALYTRAIQDKYKHETGNFVLSVYENAGTMEAVKKRIIGSRDFAGVARALHFATLESVKADICTAWTLADGTPVSLF